MNPNAWRDLSGVVLVVDDEGKIAYMVRIYRSTVTGQWDLRYMHGFTLIQTRSDLPDQDVVDFLTSSPLGPISLESTLLNLDPRIPAILVARELEL